MDASKGQGGGIRQLLRLTTEGEAPYLRFLRIFIGNILITGAYAFITGISISFWVDFLTVLLIVISLIFLGKTYFVGALFSSVCYMVLFNLFHWTGFEVVVPLVFGTPILATPIAAILVAGGYYFCIAAKATAVSFDTVAMILNKKNPRFNIATTMMVINIAVLLTGAATYSLSAVVCGIVFTFLQGQCLKLFLKFGGIEQVSA